MHLTQTSTTARRVAEFDGDKTYLGKPCRHGHTGIRYTANAGCVECVRRKALHRHHWGDQDRERERKRLHAEKRRLQEKRRNEDNGL
jgi:hypothetical protein